MSGPSSFELPWINLLAPKIEPQPMAKILKHLCESLRLASHPCRRFPARVLAPLVDAGWHEGRKWESGQLRDFLAGFDMVFPPVAVRVLSEFGGLDVGTGGRMLFFGHMDDRLCASHKTVGRLTGEPLFPLGVTNIFEDDGLGVFSGESGRIYVDGATGHDHPRDYRVDLIEDNIDRFLIRLFSRKPVPEKQSWYYSEADLE